MRKILFRGKRLDGEWLEGNLATYPSGTYKIVITTSKQPIFGTLKEVIPETVGQYTGLTDKNGKEIFEGDIVKGKDNSDKDIKVCGYVDFMNGSFVVAGDLITRYRWIDYELEVIGNIHDTPELLEAEE